MQHTDKHCQTQVVRICLEQNTFQLVELGATTALLFRRLIKPNRHGREHLELEIRHGLENDLERKNGCRVVDWDVLGLELPEFIWEDYGLEIELSAWSE